MGILVENIILTQRIIAKAPGLLHMRYKLTEIAEKLDINPRTIADWTNAGLPHERDERGHIWIIGTEFASWVEEKRLARKNRNSHQKLSDNQVYCLRCNKPVLPKNLQIITGNGKQIYIKGNCPKCGCSVNRGGRNND